MKGKTKRIVVVGVKRHHRANGLSVTELYTFWKPVFLVSIITVLFSSKFCFQRNTTSMEYLKPYTGYWMSWIDKINVQLFNFTMFFLHFLKLLSVVLSISCKVPHFHIIWGVAKGTLKNVGLGKFWQDLEISKAFLISLEVSFFHGLFLLFLSLETFHQRVSGSDF